MRCRFSITNAVKRMMIIVKKFVATIGDLILYVLCLTTFQYIPRVCKSRTSKCFSLCWSLLWILYFVVGSIIFAVPPNILPAVMMVYSYVMKHCPIKYYDVCYTVLLYGPNPNSTTIPRLVLREEGLSNPSDDLNNTHTGSLLAKFVDFDKVTFTFACFATAISFLFFLLVLFCLYVIPHVKKIIFSCFDDDNSDSFAIYPLHSYSCSDFGCYCLDKARDSDIVLRCHYDEETDRCRLQRTRTISDPNFILGLMLEDIEDQNIEYHQPHRRIDGVLLTTDANHANICNCPQQCPVTNPPTEQDSLLTTSCESHVNVFNLRQQSLLEENKSFCGKLKTINSASFFIILLVNVVLNSFLFWLFFHGLLRPHNQTKLNNENNPPNTSKNLYYYLELVFSISYTYSTVSSMASCFIFSKIAYNVLQKCISLSNNMYDINRPDLKMVCDYNGMSIDEDPNKIRLEYLKKRYNNFAKIVKKTLCYFELWFFFHWILYVVTFALSFALFIEAVHLKVMSDGPKKEGVNFSKYELVLLGMYALSNSFFFLYPCFNAAAITESKGILIRKINKISQTSLQYVPRDVIEQYEKYLRSQNFSFEFRFLCFRIPFGYKIAIGSIILSVFGFVIKFAIT